MLSKLKRISTHKACVCSVFLLTACPSFAEAGFQRCPTPAFSLCNRQFTNPNSGYDSLIEKYFFKNETGSVRSGDRDLIWWALAGGDAGRYWWSKDVEKGKGVTFAEWSGSIVGNGPEGSANVGPAKRDLAEDIRRQVLEDWAVFFKEGLEKLQEKQRWNGSLWSEDEQGFCCSESMECMGLEMDKSLAVCIDRRNLTVLTPGNVTLNIKSMDYVLPNGTHGNLRDFTAPGLNKNTRYDPASPKLSPGNHTLGLGHDFRAAALKLGGSMWSQLVIVLLVVVLGLFWGM